MAHTWVSIILLVSSLWRILEKNQLKEGRIFFSLWFETSVHNNSALWLQEADYYSSKWLLKSTWQPITKARWEREGLRLIPSELPPPVSPYILLCHLLIPPSKHQSINGLIHGSSHHLTTSQWLEISARDQAFKTWALGGIPHTQDILRAPWYWGVLYLWNSLDTAWPLTWRPSVVGLYLTLFYSPQCGTQCKIHPYMPDAWKSGIWD